MTPAQVKGKEQGLPAEGPASVVQEEGAGVRGGREGRGGGGRAGREEVVGQGVHTGDPLELHTQVCPQAVVQVPPGEQVSAWPAGSVAAGQEGGQVPYLPAPLTWVPLGKVWVEHQGRVTEATGGAHSRYVIPL